MALAHPGRRLAAVVLDTVIASFVFVSFGSLLYSPTPDRDKLLVLNLAAIAFFFTYLVLFDGGKRGATPGKRIVGIRVVDETTGGPIGMKRAAIRRLGYLLGGLLLYVGWLWILFDGRRQAWHDKWAHSLVVRTRSRGS